jgi:hypothetical protein
MTKAEPDKAEVQLWLKEYLEGVEAKDIAAKYKRSHREVHRKLFSHGVYGLSRGGKR